MISDKIKASKAKHDNKETIAELEEIIMELSNDKRETLRIAQTYEQELISQKITEKDIEYITKNLLPIISQYIPQDKVTMQQIESLLSVETLTIMQLLGFNYKKAIGEPLTLLIQKNIESKLPYDQNLNSKTVLSLSNLALDEEAYKRYLYLVGQPSKEE